MKIFALSILSLACRAIAFGVGGSILAAGSIFAQEQPVEKIAQGELPSLLAIYKDIHSHPELSTREEKTSAVIGTARALQRLKERWSGTIVFVGQPAEETVGGARALLKAGLYNRFGKPDFALGFHDKADLQTGQIGVTPGYTYANVDSVDVTVRGIGGHGAYPHKTKDPIVLAAEMINAWQTIASRENNPLDPIVVTVGSIHGGTK